jgi:hypothetical protein
MSDSRDIQRKFEDWIDSQIDYGSGRLPHGFEHVDHDDPWAFIVTDGKDEYVIEFSVDVIKQPRVAKEESR